MWVDLRSLWESSGSADVTVALTGVEVSGAVGSVAVAFTLAFTGVGGTGSVGSVAPSITASLSGNAGTGSVGSVAITNGLALVGVGGSGSVGTVAPLSAIPLPGSSATSSVGSLALSFDLAITGNEGTSAAGTISVAAAADVTAALSGAAATAQVGNVSITAVSAEVTPSGGSSRRPKGKRPPYWWERTREVDHEIPVLPEFVAPPDPVPVSMEVMPPRVAFSATPYSPELEKEQKRQRMLTKALAALLADDDE